VSFPEIRGDLEGRIAVVAGDITRLRVDAIVNAANESLLGGGGVDGAIHRAAGARLLEECRAIGHCPTGEARLTGGYGLPARWVIHAVGPVYRGGAAGEAGLLGSCYHASLQLASRNEIRTLAFPSIATGAYGYPVEDAAKIAIRSVAAWLVANALPERVLFCCFAERDERIYRELIAALAG
jgi:O-acetyl-ADP-ribose deacetylase (regulator of RNase III)